MTDYTHLTFTELEIHIEVANRKLQQTEALTEQSVLQQQIDALNDELNNRRDKLLT